MTDAAVPVTQSVVEQFTDQYLRSIGCTIEKQEGRWDVTVPNEVDTELTPGNHILVCGDDVDEGGNVEPLHPESQFFQQILTEASERTPTGKISIESGCNEVEIPSWLQKSDVELKEAQFTPYYDRTAIVILFRVSIETVSEYQSEILRTVAMDIRSGENLPKLEETFLRVTSLNRRTVTTRSKLDKTRVRPLLDDARSKIVKRVQPQIDEIHQEASRAADAEVEEYRQMQQQRIQELEERHSNLSSKINDLSGITNRSGQEERIQALKDRKELKSEYEKIDAELMDLRQRREQGFPERQQEIRERHALDVQVSPLTITEVEYERGEIELELIEKEEMQTVTVGYGSGVGVMEEVRCSSCSEVLCERNPLLSIREGLQCEKCSQQGQ